MLTTILIVLATIALGVILYLLILYNNKKYKEENDVLNDKTLSKNEMNKSISSYIKKVGRFGDFTLIYLDIDNFTNLNEIFGREQCDEFLQEISNRISKRLPYHTVVSKYNNDEFLVFIKENLTYEQACKVCDSLLNDIKQKLYVSSNESISLTASAGICLYPSCGKTAQELIKNLELATYISKREGGAKYTVYYSNLSKEETSNFKFFKEVKKAISNKEFCLYYQPIMDLQKNSIYGFEALMRWNHPERGVLPPAEFLSILDQSGDIYWVGKWGLELAVKTLSEAQKLIDGGDAHISLNLSVKQLSYEKLADDLILVAKKASINPKNVIFEIAGFAMFEKVDNVKQNLMKLRDFGFLTAVDGFELDYSTLTKIQKEPIDMIKLNRAFLTDKNSNEEIREKFVKMLVESASLTKRIVVSEGIETLENVTYVMSQGITFGQGYYYSKPMPEGEVADFIRYRKWEENAKAAPKTNEEASNNEEDNNGAQPQAEDDSSNNEEDNTSSDITSDSTQNEDSSKNEEDNASSEDDNDITQADDNINTNSNSEDDDSEEEEEDEEEEDKKE